jgi:phage N-6-adenine-methyltransferase
MLPLSDLHCGGMPCYIYRMKTPPAYCATCGKRLTIPHRTGRKPRYCFRSNACRQKAYRKRVKAKRSAKLQRDRLVHLRQVSFEWYTPQKYLRAVRAVLGEIDLDPASSEQANRIVQAKIFYDLATDGLTKTWKARTVWLNPPYCKQGNTSNQAIWTAKLLAEYKAGNVHEAILLVTSATETTWFHRLYPFPMCFVKGRIQFTTPTGKAGGATKGSIFVYMGIQPERFRQVFGRFGVVK